MKSQRALALFISIFIGVLITASTLPRCNQTTKPVVIHDTIKISVTDSSLRDSLQDERNINKILATQLTTKPMKVSRPLSTVREPEDDYVSVDQEEAQITMLNDSLNEKEKQIGILQAKLANSVQYPFHLSFNDGEIICLVESATKRGIVHMTIHQVGTRPPTIYQNKDTRGIKYTDSSFKFNRPALAPKSVLDRHH